MQRNSSNEAARSLARQSVVRIALGGSSRERIAGFPDRAGEDGACASMQMLASDVIGFTFGKHIYVRQQRLRFSLSHLFLLFILVENLKRPSLSPAGNVVLGLLYAMSAPYAKIAPNLYKSLVGFERPGTRIRQWTCIRPYAALFGVVGPAGLRHASPPVEVTM